MNGTPAATHYADDAVQRRVTIQENVSLSDDVFRVRFACPEIACRGVPGQFVMVRSAHRDDPLIGRPLALYDILLSSADEPTWIDLVYRVGGRGTSELARMRPGQALDVWGPLGNGFPTASGRPLIMVAGGIGQTPFLLLGKEALGQAVYGVPARPVRSTRQVYLCYGAKTAAGLVGTEDFERAGITTTLATDDGTRGHHGFVTDLLKQRVDSLDEQPEIACCGPKPMMRRVSEFAAQRQLTCHVSLETPMACGIGICFTCVEKIRTGDDRWDYQRTCVCGPVFDANDVAWDE